MYCTGIFIIIFKKLILFIRRSVKIPIVFSTTGCNNPVGQNPFQNVWLPLAYFLLFSVLQRIRSDPKYRIKKKS